MDDVNTLIRREDHGHAIMSAPAQHPEEEEEPNYDEEGMRPHN